MITALSVTNYRSESLTMTLANPWGTGLNITNIDGIGAPESTVNISDLATTDGGVFTSARAQVRTITVTIKPIATHTANVEQSRLLIYKYFPVKKLCTLVLETTEHSLQIEGYVSKISPKIFSNEEEVDIEIKCPDPFFYIAGEGESVVITGVDPEFEFPFESEIESASDKRCITYNFSVANAELVYGRLYYVTIPGYGDLEFKMDGREGTLERSFSGTVRAYTYDGVLGDGEITITGVGTAAMSLRSTATEEAFAHDPRYGKEIWATVVVNGMTINPGSNYYIRIPDYGYFKFTYPRTGTAYDAQGNPYTKTYSAFTIYSFACNFSINNHVITDVGDISVDGGLFDLSSGQSGTHLFSGNYTVEKKATEYLPSGVTWTYVGETEVPTRGNANVLTMGEIKTTRSGVVLYDGNAETGFVMIARATGSVGAFSVYAPDYGGYFAVDTSKVPGGFIAGDSIEISTRSGNKYVRLLRGGSYTNIINAIDRDSTWFQLLPGVNTFVYSANSGEEHLTFMMSYRTAYQGV